MPFHANVCRILIASPGDVKEEREAIRKVIYDWNSANGDGSKGIFLEPVMWETHSAPELGKYGQAVINEQLVKKCDLLIGVFFKKFGTPTEKAESGTVEEIDLFRAANKLAMIYFCIARVPKRISRTKQYRRVQEYKRILFENKTSLKGLVAEYKDIDEFQKKVNHHLTIQLNSYAKNHASPNKGLRRTMLAWSGKPSDKFILEQEKLRILLKDGHSFFKHRADVLTQRFCDLKKETEIIIVHPDYKYIGAVADMDSEKRGFPETQKADCFGSIQKMHEIRKFLFSKGIRSVEKRTKFLGYLTVPTWTGFISDTEAFVSFYQTYPYRGPLLSFEISAKDDDGVETEWYGKYKTEFENLARMTMPAPIVGNLWKYKLP